MAGINFVVVVVVSLVSMGKLKFHLNTSYIGKKI